MPLRLRCWVTVELIVPRHCDEFGKVWICLDSSLAASNSVWLLHQAMIWFGFWKLGCKSSQWTLYRWGVAPPGCTVLEVFMLLSTSEKKTSHVFLQNTCIRHITNISDLLVKGFECFHILVYLASLASLFLHVSLEKSSKLPQVQPASEYPDNRPCSRREPREREPSCLENVGKLR